MERITDGNHPGQALLGGYQGSPWSPDGTMILAVKPPPSGKAGGQAASGLIHIGAFKRAKGGDCFSCRPSLLPLDARRSVAGRSVPNGLLYCRFLAGASLWDRVLQQPHT